MLLSLAVLMVYAYTRPAGMEAKRGQSSLQSKVQVPELR